MSVAAPQLPPSASAWTPSSEGTDLVIISMDTMMGLEVSDFRQLAASMPFANCYTFVGGSVPLVPPLPTNGSLRVTAIGPAGE